MSKADRVQLLVKAGLMSQDEADKVKRRLIENGETTDGDDPCPPIPRN
jgi:hypothetical protein